MAGEIDVCTRIREELVALLRGLPFTYDNVFTERAEEQEFAEDQLPAIEVDAADENQNVQSGFGGARVVEGEILMRLRVTVMESELWQTRIDEVFRAARVKIADNNTLGGLCKWIHPAGKDEPEHSINGTTHIARQVQGYRVFYLTPLNAPHTPL